MRRVRARLYEKRLSLCASGVHMHIHTGVLLPDKHVRRRPRNQRIAHRRQPIAHDIAQVPRGVGGRQHNVLQHDALMRNADADAHRQNGRLRRKVFHVSTRHSAHVSKDAIKSIICMYAAMQFGPAAWWCNIRHAYACVCVHVRARWLFQLYASRVRVCACAHVSVCVK